MRRTPEDRFRELYEGHVDAILAYAVRRVPAPPDAADVVAETFLIAWRRVGEVPRGHDARLWLYGVARRVLANHLRGEQRRHRLGERLRSDLAHHVVVPDPAADIAGIRAVRDALARLEPADREVLELSAWEELAPREIAVALGLSPTVVRARLSRARNRLRAALDGHDDAAPGQEPDDRSATAPRREIR